MQCADNEREGSRADAEERPPSLNGDAAHRAIGIREKRRRDPSRSKSFAEGRHDQAAAGSAPGAAAVGTGSRSPVPTGDREPERPPADHAAA